jgi:hypothetical protein
MRALYDSFVLFPLAEHGAPGFRVFPNTRALYSVRLWGPLEPLWADHFSLGLSSLGLSILNGFARQDDTGGWGAEFLITTTGGPLDPASVDYLALTQREPAPRQASAVVLDDYALDGSPERGAALYLEVRGPDRLGFLGSLLRTLADLDLVPKEMTIGTRDGQAFDRFLLKAAAGGVPSDRTRQALAATLDRLVRRRASRGAAALEV